VKTIAVVPVKALAEAKTRLAGVLSPEQRVALTLEMLHHVLDAITRSGVVEVVAVIGPNPEGLDLPGSVVYVKQAREGLNHAVGQGKEWAMGQGADAYMVVLGDLPLLTPDDIVHVVDLGLNSNTVVLAPDRHNTGTNIMLAHPASLARFAYGVESFPKHMKMHQEAGASVQTYVSLGTAVDMDTPGDLYLLENSPVAAAHYL
jgi:2-phospho-L-lactate guanylyltransferase